MASEYQATVVISDYKRIIRELNKIDTALTRELRQNFREIGQIPRAEIRKTIPKSPPLSGMRRKLSPVGKTWHTRRRANTVQLKLDSPKRAVGVGTKNAAIIKLIVSSPATIIADMAGRGNMASSIRGGRTQWYVYPRSTTTSENYRPGQRRHRVTTQGEKMIEKLGGSPSRYVYPAVERVMPDTADKIYAVLGAAEREIERKING